MKKLQILLLFIIASLISVTAEAQFFKKIGKKLEKKAEQVLDRKAREKESKADRKIDKGADDADNAATDAVNDVLKGNKSKKSKKTSKSTNSNSTNSADEPQTFDIFGTEDSGIMEMAEKMKVANSIELPATYSFTKELTYRAQYNGKKENDVTYLFGKEKKIVGAVADDDMTLVFDLNKDAIVMFSTEKKKKTAQVVPLDIFDSKMFSSKDNSGEASKINKVAGTKIIAGYPCEKWEFSSKDQSGYVWVTNKMDPTVQDISNLYRQVFKQMDFSVVNMLTENFGVMMEMHSTNAKGGKVTDIKFLSLETGATVINTKSYERTRM